MFLLAWTLRAAGTVEVRSEQSKLQAIMFLMAGSLRRAGQSLCSRNFHVLKAEGSTECGGASLMS